MPKLLKVIEFIQGTVYSIQENAIILQAGNWGFKILTHKRNLDNIGLNQKLLLFTYLHVNENKIALYGFLTQEEKEIFEHLITINNVGPAKALNILELFTPEELIKVIKEENVKRLTMAKGISQETAITIIARLSKSLLQKQKIEYTSIKKDNIIYTEATNSLKQLGLTSSQAKELVMQALKEKNFSSTEELIQYILMGKNMK